MNEMTVALMDIIQRANLTDTNEDEMTPVHYFEMSLETFESDYKEHFYYEYSPMVPRWESKNYRVIVLNDILYVALK